MDLYDIKRELERGKTIYDIKMRVTYYARVSTEKYEQAHSLTAQIGHFEDYIRKNPNWIFSGGYVDEGLSGTNASKRDAFMSMINDARLGRFDFIITKEISRFSRNTLDSISYTQELLRCGVGVLFQSDNINTLLPDAELRLTIMSSIAQDEVRKLSERVRFGFLRSIENGVVLGNSNIWGYKKEGGRLVIVEQEAEIVREIFDLYVNKGLGMRLICEQLTARGRKNSRGGAFSPTTVRGILSNPKYKGYYCGRKSVKLDYRMSGRKQLDEEQWKQYRDEQNVPPIVSEQLWDRASEIRRSRRKSMTAEQKTSYNNKYTYSGKLRCAQHGDAYHRAFYRSASGGREAWQCRRFAEKGLKGCTSPTVYTDELDVIAAECLRLVLPQRQALAGALLDIYLAAARGGGAEAEARAETERMRRVAGMKDKLLQLALDGRVTDEEFQARNADFNEQLEQARQRLAQLADERERLSAMQNGDELLRAISQELELAAGINGGIVGALIDRVEVSPLERGAALSVHLRPLADPVRYSIKRQRGKASVCVRQYT